MARVSPEPTQLAETIAYALREARERQALQAKQEQREQQEGHEREREHHEEQQRESGESLARTDTASRDYRLCPARPLRGLRRAV